MEDIIKRRNNDDFTVEFTQNQLMAISKNTCDHCSDKKWNCKIKINDSKLQIMISINCSLFVTLQLAILFNDNLIETIDDTLNKIKQSNFHVEFMVICTGQTIVDYNTALHILDYHNDDFEDDITNLIINYYKN
jgi:hypothetical protein